MKCPLCNIAAMISKTEEKSDSVKLLYVCRNKRCTKYLSEIGEETIPNNEDEA